MNEIEKLIVDKQNLKYIEYSRVNTIQTTETKVVEQQYKVLQKEISNVVGI